VPEGFASQFGTALVFPYLLQNACGPPARSTSWASTRSSGRSPRNARV